MIQLTYNDELCKQIHREVNDKFILTEKRLNDHSERLDTMEQDSREYNVQISNLCKQVGDLVSTIKWLIALAVPTVLTIIGLMLRK